MTLSSPTTELTAVIARLDARARELLDRGADYAAFLHADEVGPEHVLCALMSDDACAAYRATVHAFADPETIADEVRALAAGIMVSGSAASLPFSTLGVRALRRARASAAARAHESVEIAHLLLAAFEELSDELRARFVDAGWNGDASAFFTEQLASTRAVSDSGALFRHFSDLAKRMLSAAARLARQANAPSIGPAQLIAAALQANPLLERTCGISASRARLLLREHALDATPPEATSLGPDDSLTAFVRGLPPSADSLDFLSRFHGESTPEIGRVLARHKVTPALLARARAAFQDAP